LFIKFKGGKVVATYVLIFFVVISLLFLAILLTFLLSLKLTKYVSLSSMITGVVATIISIFLDDILLFLMIFALTLFVIYRHKENIKRIKNKTEPKITWL